MSRFILCLAALSLITACAQPAQPAKEKTTETISARSGTESDQDLCYQKSSDPGHNHQMSLDACQTLIATGEYQGFTLARFHNNAGAELDDLYRYEDAIAAFDRAIAIKPDYARAWRNKSYTLNELYRYEAALVAVDRALEIQPESGASVGHKGRVLRNLERLSEARDALELARALSPNDDWVVRELGWVFHDEDNFKRALKQFEAALKMDPKDHWNHYAIGYVLLDLNRHDDALAAFDRAIEINQQAPSLYNLRGYTRLIEKTSEFDVRRATTDLERAIQLHPRHEYALHHLAVAYAYQGRGAEAVAMLKRGVDVRILKSKVRRVVRILWDKKLKTHAMAASDILKKAEKS